MSPDELGAFLDGFERPEALRVNVDLPMGYPSFALRRERLRHIHFSSEQARSVHMRMLGDIELNLDKYGRRFFENPRYGDEEAERLEQAWESASHREKERLERELTALTERLERERSAMLPSLLEALAESFRPASMKVYLDFHDYVPPRATMAYYRDAEALKDDLLLIADAEEELCDPLCRGAYLRYALGFSPEFRSPSLEAEPFPLAATWLARLRSVTAEEVRRAAEAAVTMVTPMGEGFLIADEDLHPVYGSVTPWFRGLLAAEGEPTI